MMSQALNPQQSRSLSSRTSRNFDFMLNLKHIQEFLDKPVTQTEEEQHSEQSNSSITTNELKSQFPVKPKVLPNANDITTGQNPNKKTQGKKWNIPGFEIHRTLENGRFGDVFLATEKRTRTLLIMKVFSKGQLKMNDVKPEAERHFDIPFNLRHENILKMLGFFHDTRRIYVLLEYATRGDLYALLKEQPSSRLDKTRTAIYIYRLAEALKYCHRKGVFYGNVKPENLFIGTKGQLKIAGFGWLGLYYSSRRGTLCGFLDYSPPEVVTGSGIQDHSVDLWGIGVLCYECLTGHTPFLSETGYQTFKKIKEGSFKMPPYLTKGAKSLIKKLIVVKADKRLSLDGIMKHKWVAKHLLKSK